ncbi:glycosyltransferase, partial [Micromonospora sp. DH15]|nr:glycosyltransferase [Micromonospora sp. DH15]
MIAAHDEANVIGGCLDALLADADTDAGVELDVVVVANGCTDDTARVAAARPGVRVVELAEAGKAHALNAGDAVVRGFPRFYLDAAVGVDADVVADPEQRHGALAGVGGGDLHGLRAQRVGGVAEVGVDGVVAGDHHHAARRQRGGVAQHDAGHVGPGDLDQGEVPGVGGAGADHLAGDRGGAGEPAGGLGVLDVDLARRG